MKLPNYVKGQWSEGASPGEALTDPVTGQELARISSQGINLAEALAFARTYGGPALRRSIMRKSEEHWQTGKC